jgi:hypothetical protein
MSASSRRSGSIRMPHALTPLACTVPASLNVSAEPPGDVES